MGQITQCTHTHTDTHKHSPTINSCLGSNSFGQMRIGVHNLGNIYSPGGHTKCVHIVAILQWHTWHGTIAHRCLLLCPILLRLSSSWLLSTHMVPLCHAELSQLLITGHHLPSCRLQLDGHSLGYSPHCCVVCLLGQWNIYACVCVFTSTDIKSEWPCPITKLQIMALFME